MPAPPLTGKSTALLVLLLCVLGVTHASAQTGSISGTVTNAANAAPIANVRVWAAPAGASFGSASALTNGSGVYTISGLAAGQYTLYTQNSSGFLNEIYDNLPCTSFCDPIAGTPVTVTAGATTSGRDFALAQGGSITGTVTNAAGGAPLAGVTVFAAAAIGGTQVSFSAQTNGAGVYTVTGLLTGSYALITSNSLGFVNEVWDNVPCVPSCSTGAGVLVPVTAGGSVSGKDFALDLGGQITGVVTNATTSAPVANVRVQAARLDGSRFPAFSATTNASGVYTVKGLPAGNYSLSTNNSSGLIDEVFDNFACTGRCSLDDINTRGTPIAVTLSGTTSGKDFQLDPGGVISGTVTDSGTGAGIGNVFISAFTVVNGVATSVGGTSTNSNGNYSVTGLTTGQYFLSTSNSSGYGDAIFTGITCPGTCTQQTTVGSGTAVAVTKGATTSGTNFALTRGGSISGVITDAATGTPIANIGVTAYRRIRGQVVIAGQGGTNSSGAFTVGGLATGSYELYAGDRNAYGSRIFGGPACIGACRDVAALVAGTSIPVFQGADTPGKNFQLSRGGAISGVLTDAGTGLPLQNEEVEIFTVVAGRYSQVDSVRTNAAGLYVTNSGLATGNYYAAAVANGYTATIFPNSTCVILDDCLAAVASGAATPIAVTAGATTTGRDFALARAGSITGVVTDGATGQPLGGVEMHILRLVNGRGVVLNDDATQTDSQGRYSFGELTPGSYVVYTQTRRAYVDKVYASASCDGECTGAFAGSAGTPITVNAGAPTAGVNIALAPRLAPGSPTDLRAVVTGGGNTTFTWTAPLTAFGGAATSYLIEAGFAPGTTAVSAPLPSPSLTVTIQPGTYYIRVRGVNASGPGAASAELVLTILPTGFQALQAPRGAVAFVNGPQGGIAALTFTWSPPAAGAVPSGYVIEVGTATGLANVGTLSTTQTSFSYPAVPPGVYFMRVRAIANGATGPASDESMVVVGGVPAPPDPPVCFMGSASGGVVTLSWYAPANGPTLAYQVEAGTAAGLANLGIANVGAATSFSVPGVPPGRYYLRVRGMNALGLSVVSQELVLDVP